MRSRIEESLITIAADLNLPPEKAFEMAEIGSEMTFNMLLEQIIPQLGNVVETETSFREFLLSMVKLGAIKYNYDLPHDGEEEDDE